MQLIPPSEEEIEENFSFLIGMYLVPIAGVFLIRRLKDLKVRSDSSWHACWIAEDRFTFGIIGLEIWT